MTPLIHRVNIMDLEEIKEFIESGDFDIAEDLLNADYEEYCDSFEDWEKIYWGRIPSNDEEWREAQEIRLSNI